MSDTPRKTTAAYRIFGSRHVNLRDIREGPMRAPTEVKEVKKIKKEQVKQKRLDLGKPFLVFAYRRYEASGLLTPHTGSMEKHWASTMIGLMAACRLSVEGLKISDGGTTGASTKKRRS